MNYFFDVDSWGSHFSVPSTVVNDYIKLCDGNFVKVLLCILCNGKRQQSTSEISALSGLNEDIVDDAVIFWSNYGILKNSGAEQPNVMPVQKVVPAMAELESAKTVLAVESVKPTEKEVDRKVVVTYSHKEILEKSEKDKNFKQLLDEIQNVLKFSINGREIGKLVELYDLYHFDVPTILLVAQYCADMDKKSVQYLMTVMEDWYRRDITTYDQAEAEIVRQTAQKSYENEVMKCFGMTAAKLSSSQSEMVGKWNSMGITLPLLEIAYNKCMDSTSKLNFKYIDAVISSWAGKNIKTPEQVQADDEKFREKNNKKNNNIEKDNSYNLDDFEQYAMNFNPGKKGAL